MFDGAAGDGRAPTEELSCVRGLGCLFDGSGGRVRIHLAVPSQRGLEDPGGILGIRETLGNMNFGSARRQADAKH